MKRNNNPFESKINLQFFAEPEPTPEPIPEPVPDAAVPSAIAE